MLPRLPPWLAFALLLVPAYGFGAGTVLLSEKQLVAALQHGGCVILMRHASSPGALPDGTETDADNLKHERQLDAAGRKSAQAMGEAFRRLRIHVGEVLSSPTYRALETARQAQLPEPHIFNELGEDDKDSAGGDRNARAAWLRSRIAQDPKRGTNTVIITHYPNITDAYATDARDLAEGDALIFEPDGRGSAPLVGRVKIAEWPKLTGPGNGAQQ